MATRNFFAEFYIKELFSFFQPSYHHIFRNSTEWDPLTLNFYHMRTKRSRKNNIQDPNVYLLFADQHVLKFLLLNRPPCFQRIFIRKTRFWYSSVVYNGNIVNTRPPNSSNSSFFIIGSPKQFTINQECTAILSFILTIIHTRVYDSLYAHYW